MGELTNDDEAALRAEIAEFRAELEGSVGAGDLQSIRSARRRLAEIGAKLADLDVEYPSAVLLAPILRVIERTRLDDIADVPATLAKFGMYDPVQSLWTVALDVTGQLRKIVEVARGHYNNVDVPIAAVLSAVLLSAADRFLIVHNHPSGVVVTPNEISGKPRAQHQRPPQRARLPDPRRSGIHTPRAVPARRAITRPRGVSYLWR